METQNKYELSPTEVSFIDRDPEFGDFIVSSDLFTIEGLPGMGLLDNKDSHIQYRQWPVVDDDGQPVLDDETGEPQMAGEYFLTLYLEHETMVPVTDENGQFVRDDYGRLVQKRSRKAEIIATDLTPSSEGRQTRVANKFARKMASVRKYRAKDPRTVKRGRKPGVEIDPADISTFQVELGQDHMWHVVKLGEAEPVAKFPGTADGRNAARARASKENNALKQSESAAE